MEFKFDSIEEVLKFARDVNRHAVIAPGAVTPAGVDPIALVDHLARVADHADKIAAVKIYRAVTGEGLKTSKEAIERALIFRSKPIRDHGIEYNLNCGDPTCCNEDDTPF